jgi:hypothetical protein
MEAHATYDDVNLVLRLYELRREEKLRAARDWFTRNVKAANLDELAVLCPMGSQENAYYRMVLSYWEMAASFITAGVLNADLFFQSGGEMLVVWERVKHLVPPAREAYKSPGMYRNLEAAANLFIQWMNKNSAGAYEAFSERIRSM